MSKPADSKPTVQRAIQQYASVMGVDPNTVTEQMLEESEEGIEHWACLGIDSKARGPMGNAMYRSIKKHPEAAEAYRWLFDDLKKIQAKLGYDQEL